MSASLVGSEMCIRDRASSAFAGRGGRFAGRASGSSRAASSASADLGGHFAGRARGVHRERAGPPARY
eukprot:2957330-Alexandrium_andersonii.AAC.1